MFEYLQSKTYISIKCDAINVSRFVSYSKTCFKFLPNLINLINLIKIIKIIIKLLKLKLLILII